MYGGKSPGDELDSFIKQHLNLSYNELIHLIQPPIQYGSLSFQDAFIEFIGHASHEQKLIKDLDTSTLLHSSVSNTIKENHILYKILYTYYQNGFKDIGYVRNSKDFIYYKLAIVEKMWYYLSQVVDNINLN